MSRELRTCFLRLNLIPLKYPPVVSRVKLGMYWLQKCPQSTLFRNDLFYYFFYYHHYLFFVSYFNSSGWRHVERYFRTKEWRASYTANEKFIVALKTLTSLKEQYCKRENRNRADDSRRRRLSRFHTVSLYGCIFRLRCLFTSYRCKSIPTDSLILRAHCIPRASILTALMLCGRIRGLIGQLPVSKPT